MKKLTKKLPLIIILTILGTVLFVSLFAGFLAPYDPLQIDMSNRLAAPSAAHFLGTDTLGRDVFSRILYGGRQSILLALAATICSMLFGLFIGIVEGYFGGLLDVVLTAISNVFQGLPGMIVMIALVGVLGPGTKSIILALIITSWVGFSRIVRGEVLRVKSETYIEGLRNLGAGRLRIIAKSVIPNISANLIVLFATRVGRVILAVSGLSYLGIGIQPPTPDWGAMISDARRYFRTAPHLLWAPGLCIILLTLAINMLGDYLRDKSDVKRDAEAGATAMHDIRIKDLDIWFDTSLGKVSAVRGLSADFRAGHISGVIGESGSGKSVMGLSILRLLPETAHISGQCLYGEQDLYALPLRQLRALRGSEIGLIPQNPSASMNPVIKLRRQMTEAMAVHGGASGKKAARLAAGMLEQFGFQNPDNILKSFSFQMSGGMNQRLVSALALMCRPGWIIADEPTKGLDAILRRQVYSVMRQICTPERGMIVITHDLQLAGKLCHDLRVMYMGQIVEQGPAGDVTAWPRHPYTQGLIGAMVQNGLKPIPFPDKDKTGGGGCAFYPRCPKAMPRCRDEIPNDYPTGPDAKVKCFLYA